jgi:hypothetical protein
MKKSFIGYISNKDKVKWSECFGENCKSESQCLLDVPKIWQICDEVYIFSSEAVKVKITIETVNN